MKKAFNCPLCGGFVAYRVLLPNSKEEATHIYSCKECPFMALEAYSAQNIQDLKDYFEAK